MTSEIETAIVHLADVLANRSELGAFCEQADAEGGRLDESVWETLGLDPEQFDGLEVIGEAGLQFTETAGLLLARA